MKKLLLAVTVALLVSMVAYARPVRLWQPEELYNKADVVIIAAVKEITQTGKTSEIQLGDQNPKLKTVERVAQLHVQHIIKGASLPERCELKYEILDPKSAVAIINGPERIQLAKGKVYLLYLKKTQEKDSFIGVLAGDFDDYQAAKEIRMETPNNPDVGDGK